MGTAIQTIFNAARQSNDIPISQAIMNLADAVRGSGSANPNGSQSEEAGIPRWVIIAVAVVAAFFLLRCVRRMSGFAFAIFWIWFWTSGSHHHFFSW